MQINLKVTKIIGVNINLFISNSRYNTNQDHIHDSANILTMGKC